MGSTSFVEGFRNKQISNSSVYLEAMEGYNTILVEREPPLAVVTLNRPEARNALNMKMVTELVDSLGRLEIDDQVRCVILTGNEQAFSAGADIKEMENMSPVDMLKSGHFFPLWDKVGHYTKPLIAAVSGYVLGGGLELAMCCDIIVAAEGTRLGQPEINIGVMPGGGGTQRLTRAVGKYRAMEMILTGGMITAEQALGYGLVNRVVPPESCLEEARRIGKEISAKGPLSVRLAKEAIRKADELSLSEGLEFERKSFYLLFSSEDKKEGMKAFSEKRKPAFKGV
jgi:enoyl-CoA hydratase